MGTRGVIGFFRNGKGKITYNHFDSYPDEVGVKILKEVKEFSVKEMKKAFDSITLIKDSEKKPTPEEIKKFGKFSDASVGNQGMSNTKIETYYQLFRNLQGTLRPYLTGEVNLMINSESFLKDSLFCEWGYVVNLDKEVLEIWEGFQETSQENRYKIEKPSAGDYFNCALVKEYKLSKLPGKKQFLDDLKKDD